MPTAQDVRRQIYRAYINSLGPALDAEAVGDPAPEGSREDPAPPWGAPNVRNGVYELVAPNGEHFQYRIWTVQRGSLAGKRIIKVQKDGTYRGFAFIQNDGRLRLWARFANDSHQNYVLAAETMLRILDRENAGLYVGDSLHVQEADYQIMAFFRCAVCNQTASRALCDQHHAEARAATNLVDDMWVSVLGGASTADAHHITAPSPGRQTVNAQSSRSGRSGRSANVLLCENGTGEVR